ncbi:MAG TPA: class I SAM-dependent methyltransferase [Acidobacteriaceae bacterium]|nr:class I SAM-dependent methyltransferase [Acidobacteriaceae bacterium]
MSSLPETVTAQVLAPASDFRYVGAELDVFAEAVNWKTYWSERIGRYICGDVLEVGAGIGANTPYLTCAGATRWVCLEPDRQLIEQLRANVGESSNSVRHEVACGTLASLPENERFDTLLYIDVLEHIEDDAGELKLIAEHLRPGGRVVVLSPAHQWLFTPFDAAIGHFRRYNKRSLRGLTPVTLVLESLFYVDCCGIAASAANHLLSQSMPTREQIRLWDKRMIPASRRLDALLRFSVGKSIVGVWRKGR